MPRIAIATFRHMPVEFTDDERLEAALIDRGAEAMRVAWDTDLDWTLFDLVVIRSTWDYDHRLDEFIDWAEHVGDRLLNRPELVAWNSDKRYLEDLDDAGIPVVPTEYVAPGEELPELQGEVVVKPTVSAGGRDTGRFTENTHDDAYDLIEAIHDTRRIAMVQPYLATVDTLGETALVCIDGQPSHALRKGQVLQPDEIAPVRDEPDGHGAAEIMYSPDLVGPAQATESEIRLARMVLRHLEQEFGETPLYARIDTVEDAWREPVLMELEAIEPNLYLEHADSALGRLADAIVNRLDG